MKKIVSIILFIAIVVGLFPMSLIGCSDKEEGLAKYEVIRRTVEQKEYDFSDYKVIPESGKPINKTLNYIRMDEFNHNDLFMATSLQGNVNKEDPSIYIIHDEMIEGPQDFNASEYWFDKLDEIYVGDEAFNKNEYTDPYQMVVDFKDKIKGAVLYHERLVDALNSSLKDYSSRYADMAVLNLTVMMAAKFDSVALTYEQYNTLKEKYNVELPIKGDTTLFMEKNEDGSVSDNRGSREVWARVYMYALDEFKDFNRKALGHLAGNQAATIDYFIANDIFVYNRIFGAHATKEERAIEDAIVNFSDPNTPVLGCWYLQADEGSLVPYLTDHYKFFIVNYETFNWSWSTALPEEEFKPVEKEEKVVLDESKNYIAFTFTEGDNNSYVNARMVRMFDNDTRTEADKYPIGWTWAPTLQETNPNFIRYYKQNWKDGDTLAYPEAGVDYVYHCPPEESRDEFFALSDEYMKKMGNGCLRVLGADPIDALPYAESVESMNAVLVGYFWENNHPNSDVTNFMFRNKPFFKNYNGTEILNQMKGEDQGPGFYSVSLLGWNQDPGTVKSVMQLLGDNFVCVTPNQLADLYKQKYEKEFNKITSAKFNADMTREEMGFLWKATNYSAVDKISGGRVAEEDEYFVYRFDFADAVQQAYAKVELDGEYEVEVSTDYENWYVIDRGEVNEKTVKSYDLSDFTKEGKTVYVRFGDPTPENAGGIRVYRMAVGTDISGGANFEVDAFNDMVMNVNGGELNEAGRKGEFTYEYTFAPDVQSGDLAILGGGDGLKAEISADNKTFTALELSKIGKSYYADLSGLNGKTYIRFNAAEAVQKVKFSADTDPIAYLVYSPVSNNLTRKHYISCEDTTVNEKGFNSYRQVKEDNAMVFKFRMAEGITEAALQANISGLYKVEVSNDNKNYTEVASVQPGDKVSKSFKKDISSFAVGEKEVYVRVSLSKQLAGKSVKLLNLRILTNISPDWIYEKMDSERVEDAMVKVESIGRNGDYGIEKTDSFEYSLLDKELTTVYDNTIWMHNYSIPRRVMKFGKDGQVVYKFDFNDDAFWKGLGLEKMEVNRLRLSMYMLNGFNVSASNDGKTWTEIYDTNDVNASNGGNARFFDFKLNDFVGEGKDVVYLRIKLSKVYESGKTHCGQWESIKFYFN